MTRLLSSPGFKWEYLQSFPALQIPFSKKSKQQLEGWGAKVRKTRKFEDLDRTYPWAMLFHVLLGVVTEDQDLNGRYLQHWSYWSLFHARAESVELTVDRDSDFISELDHGMGSSTNLTSHLDYMFVCLGDKSQREEKENERIEDSERRVREK